jgi:hypothetical protein
MSIRGSSVNTIQAGKMFAVQAIPRKIPLLDTPTNRDDDCPHCGARQMTPFDSENLREIVERDGGEFVAIRSSDTAEHDPDYRELGRFPSLEKAEEFMASIDLR